MKKEWKEPAVNNLAVEGTKEIEAAVHYHCAQCTKILSEADQKIIESEVNLPWDQDSAWKCSCGSKSYGSGCHTVHLATS